MTAIATAIEDPTREGKKEGETKGEETVIDEKTRGETILGEKKLGGRN